MVFSNSYFYVSIDLVMDDDWKVVVVACHPVLLSLPSTASSLFVDFEFKIACVNVSDRIFISGFSKITQSCQHVQFGDY